MSHLAITEEGVKVLEKIIPRLTYANVMSTVAVFVVLAGGSALAAESKVGTSDIKNGAVTTQKLHAQAVTGAKVKDFGLRLHDLGGQSNHATAVVHSTTSVAAGGCVPFQLTGFNPAPMGVIGSLVVGYLTDPHGHAVLDNDGVVVPTMVSATSQGGAIANLMVCASSAETVPAGSVFHYHLIGP
jgi:hypothetical protein